MAGNHDWRVINLAKLITEDPDILSEDWKSLAAMGLAGLGLAGAPSNVSAQEAPKAAAAQTVNTQRASDVVESLADLAGMQSQVMDTSLFAREFNPRVADAAKRVRDLVKRGDVEGAAQYLKSISDSIYKSTIRDLNQKNIELTEKNIIAIEKLFSLTTSMMFASGQGGSQASRDYDSKSNDLRKASGVGLAKPYGVIGRVAESRVKLSASRTINESHDSTDFYNWMVSKPALKVLASGFGAVSVIKMIDNLCADGKLECFQEGDVAKPLHNGKNLNEVKGKLIAASMGAPLDTPALTKKRADQLGY